MRKYSCWNWCYSKRYYLTHPWTFFKDLNRNIKDICMRARYGFTWTDIWNWDHWFLHTTPQMLRHMADHGSAYPGKPPFETRDEWYKWLHHIADLLETGNEEWQEEHNEYYKEYMDNLMKGWMITWTDENGNRHSKPHERTELDDKYFARAKELSEQGDANVKEAMTQLGTFFGLVWD